MGAQWLIPKKDYCRIDRIKKTTKCFNHLGTFRVYEVLIVDNIGNKDFGLR